MSLSLFEFFLFTAYRSTLGPLVGSTAVYLLSGNSLSVESSAPELHKNAVSATFNANSPTEDRSFTKSGQGWAMGGIFDGHGGWQVADFASSKFVNLLMPRLLYQSSSNESAIFKSLLATFEDIENSYIESVRGTYHLGFRDVGKVGACALVALRYDDDLYIANCGDCRAVLGSCLPPLPNAARSNDSQGRATPVSSVRYVSTRLSRDHNARTPLESLLLQQEHSNEADIIKCKNSHACYVKGRLQLTRSLGDLYLKVRTR